MDTPVTQCGLEGYFVILKPPVNDEEKTLVELLTSQTGLVDLKCTRTFNTVTNDEFKLPVGTAKNSLRGKRGEVKAKKKEYYAKPEVKQRIKEYNKTPKVKAKKKAARQRKSRILKMVPKEILIKAMKEEQERKVLEEKSSATDNMNLNLNQ